MMVCRLTVVNPHAINYVVTNHVEPVIFLTKKHSSFILITCMSNNEFFGRKYLYDTKEVTTPK